MARPTDSTDRFVFRRFGNAYHLHVETAADLERVLELDSAQWVATTADRRTLDVEPELLDRLDANGDGHIRAADVRRAVGRLLHLLQDRSGVRPGHMSLALDAIDTDTPEGTKLHETARKIARRLGASDAGTVTLDQVRTVEEQERRRGLSQAGVVLPEAAGSSDLEQFMRDAVNTTGGAEHASGAAAVSEQVLDRFLQEARSYIDWLDRARTPEGGPDEAVLPLGPATEQAYGLFRDLEDKVDHYFNLADAVRLDPALAGRVWPGAARLDGIDFADAGAVRSLLDGAPLARPDERGVLDFGQPLNPRYAASLTRLRTEVVEPLLGEEAPVLDAGQWAQVRSRLAPYARWQQTRPETAARALPADRLRGYLRDTALAEGVRRLVNESHRRAVELDDVRAVEELILYQAHLIPFVNSFVSFATLYDPDERALFEMGTLVMDGRHFNLCVRVTDRQRHVRFSDASNMFVLYVSVRDREGEERYEVAVPVTSGGRGSLQVGKRGVFYDTRGREHHAQVVHIVENPISLREAVLRPFVRLGEAMGNMVERVSTQREKTLVERGESTVTTIAEQQLVARDDVAQPAAASTVAGSPAGLVAGGAVALAALGSSFAFVARTLSGLEWTALLGGFLALILAVTVPVVVVAYLQLRRRDLSAILEGSDWGVNARLRLGRRQARAFTVRPSYPARARGVRWRSRWTWMLALVTVAAMM